MLDTFAHDGPAATTALESLVPAAFAAIHWRAWVLVSSNVPEIKTAQIAAAAAAMAFGGIPGKMRRISVAVSTSAPPVKTHVANI
jgi:hypothetical protein